MKIGLIAFVVGLVAGCLLYRSCGPAGPDGPVAQGRIDTVEVEVDPIPVAQRPPDTLRIIKTVFANDPRLAALLKKIDSLRNINNGTTDSVVAHILDSARDAWCDSVSQRRDYERFFGDTTRLKGRVFIAATGYVDSVSIAWGVPEIRAYAPRRHISASLVAGSDTLFAPGLGYTDRRGRSVQINKNLFGPGWLISGSVPIMKFR